MTDLDQFRTFLQKTNTDHDIRTHDLYTKRATMLVEVLPGSQAHFEAEFDDGGNIISIGQWDEKSIHWVNGRTYKRRK